MRGQPAQFRTTRLGPRVVVEVVGEVDYSNTASLEASLMAAAEVDEGAVTVDLTEVGYLDSSGVRSLFWVANHGVRLRIVAPRDGLVRRTLLMAGLDRIAPVDDDLSPSEDAS